MGNPVLVNVTRGDRVEAQHRGSVAVCDPAGRVVRQWGDIERLVYPRSAIKVLQALPLIETGAADAYQLSNRELALACASHNGEVIHTETVRHWLQKLQLSESDLECGPHSPLLESAAEDLIKTGSLSNRTHNNCSGKHSGMLTVCRHLDEDTHGYIEREHPAQQRWFDSVGEMCELDIRALPWNYDGCGIPVVAIPLQAIATAFARFARPDDLPQKRAEAVSRLAEAIADQPYMVAGAGRLCSELMAITGRRIFIKTGACGVYTASLPEAGLGIALKIDDGTREAAEVAILGVLQALGQLHADDARELESRLRVPIHNTRDVLTGYWEAAEALE